MAHSGRLTLTVIFEGMEGENETDYLFFLPSMSVDSAIEIIFEHFSEKFNDKTDVLDPSLEDRLECIANWGYESTKDDEISFCPGDIIKIHDKPHQVCCLLISFYFSHVRYCGHLQELCRPAFIHLNRIGGGER